MEKTIIGGNLLSDVIPKQSKQGSAYYKFPVSISLGKNEDGTYKSKIYQCTAFGKQGEFISKYFSKGAAIMIEGNCSAGAFVTEDGKAKSVLNLTVNRAFFPPKPWKNSNQNTSQQNDLHIDSSDIPF